MNATNRLPPVQGEVRPAKASAVVRLLRYGRSDHGVGYGHDPGLPFWSRLRGLVSGSLLHTKYPALKSQLEALAEEIGQNRIKAGVHYPSDYDGGVRLAKAVLPFFKG
jgi:hypothetical protein